MKIVFLILSIIFTGSGIWLITSDIGIYKSDEPATYYASGKILLNDAEWENFKLALTNEPNSDLSRITVLDEGGSKLVDLNRIKVSQKFAYGQIEESKPYVYDGKMMRYLILEWSLIAIGSIFFLIFTKTYS